MNLINKKLQRPNVINVFNERKTRESVPVACNRCHAAAPCVAYSNVRVPSYSDAAVAAHFPYSLSAISFPLTAWKESMPMSWEVRGVCSGASNPRIGVLLQFLHCNSRNLRTFLHLHRLLWRPNLLDMRPGLLSILSWLLPSSSYIPKSVLRLAQFKSHRLIRRSFVT